MEDKVMALVRFNQYPALTDLFDALEKNFFNTEEKFEGTIPAVNIKEDNDKFVLEMAAPGMKKNDFHINVEKDVLTISSEHKEEKEEKKENYARREFYYNTFSRSFNLPENINLEGIKADYKNGILNIVLPKKEETKVSREIKIS
jgi:HSP20 family protein